MLCRSACVNSLQACAMAFSGSLVTNSVEMPKLTSDKMCIRDRAYSVGATVALAVDTILIIGAYSLCYGSVSYTHLDVYKRQLQYDGLGEEPCEHQG